MIEKLGGSFFFFLFLEVKYIICTKLVPRFKFKIFIIPPQNMTDVCPLKAQYFLI